ncbi:hypothetical protein LTR64_006667 [Lithohypha guttulata]|uniref:uncharacterized protein n=1 Tax=Lithohypha guttulata TaxID=1690604 RepID=UPI002DDF4391|nr:hypothetical protein LTR51_004774 [Lithohypha guttulata]
MDQKLELLILHANTLATTLVGISDSNGHVRQRCLNFAAEIKAFVKAWSNLSTALHDPQLQARPAFTKIVERLLIDNTRIVGDLRSQLAEVKNKQQAYDAAFRNKRWIPGGKHKSAHLVVTFLTRETTILRQQQIIYANSVLDVILGVAFHAKTLGIVPATPQDAQAAIRDQLARLRAESEAKALVFREERRLGDKLIVSSLWLSTVTWHADAAQQAPFETLALQWFKVVPEEAMNVEHEDATANRADTRKLTRMFMQLQRDIHEQAQNHASQVTEYQTRHDWAESNIRQLELNQARTARDAKAQIEGLTSRLEIQQQKIDTDATTISKLEFARKSWSAHYQKQSEKLQQLEAGMKSLKQETTQQQARLENLQQKYDKLLNQNQTLRHRLEQSEFEKEALAEKLDNLQVKHSETVRENKQWKAYYATNKDKVHDNSRDAQIRKLRQEIQIAKDEIHSLKTDLANAEGSRDQLRDSLSHVESERDEQKHRADHYKERLSTGMPRRECPNSFEMRQSRRHIRGQRRSDGAWSTTGTTTSSGSRATSRDRHSRTSSSTYVGDEDSDREYYDKRASSRRRSSSTSRPSRIEAWLSPKQVHREKALA